MVDDIKNIDSPLSPLFKTHSLKKVREVNKRPEEDRSGRDTYSESDEILLSREAERLKRDKARRDKPKVSAFGAKEELEAKKRAQKEEQGIEPLEDAENGDGGEDSTKRHVNVVV